jgi:hypothetical protein
MLPRDHFFSRYLYITSTGVKCYVAAVKSCPVLHFSVTVVILFWSFGIIESITFSVEYWVLLNPGLGVVRDDALFHYFLCTDSIKRSLQVSCNFAVFNASEVSLFSRYCNRSKNVLLAQILFLLQNLLCNFETKNKRNNNIPFVRQFFLLI